jgi:hypothetical protein
MMAKWLLIPMTAFLFVSCDKKQQPVAESLPTAERKIPSPTRIEPVANKEPAPKQEAPTPPETPRSQPKETADATHQLTLTPSANRQGHPVAVPMEGKSGYVISPYNGLAIDVRDMPSGTLVQDPGFPAEEKRYFRVP